MLYDQIFASQIALLIPDDRILSDRLFQRVRRI
jgi:hypothetical protein